MSSLCGEGTKHCSACIQTSVPKVGELGEDKGMWQISHSFGKMPWCSVALMTKRTLFPAGRGVPSILHVRLHGVGMPM